MFNSCSDSSHSRGVAILFRPNLDVKILNIQYSTDGRSLLINFEFKDNIITAVSVYAPNIESERTEYFNALKCWIKEHALTSKNIIIGGDFNCCVNQSETVLRSHIKDQSRKAVQHLISDLKCSDVWQVLDKKPAHTYYDKSTGQYSRLDYIFISNEFDFDLNNVHMSQPVRENNVIDHSALICTFKIKGNNTRGPGYWKLNNQHLENDEYCKGVENVIAETLTHFCNLNSKQISWEILKNNIKRFSVAFGISLSRNNSKKIETIQMKLDDLNQKISNESNNNHENHLLKKEIVRNSVSL